MMSPLPFCQVAGCDILHAMTLYSIYLHVPFCRHRCAYCDFNTYAGMEKKIPDYVNALCREIRLVAESAGERLGVHTIFFGGGTPSLLPADVIKSILETLKAAYQVCEDVEITLEANPGTVSADYLLGLKRAGVNRLSLGMQSADNRELKWLTREHVFADVVQSVLGARKAGFDNLNLDLIFGLPGQTLAAWQYSVHQAIALEPEHLSLYSLLVEPETPLIRWVERGLVESPDDDLSAEMYEWSIEALERAGYHQYEISNWAKPGRDGQIRSCRHNLQYWLNLPYLGFGAGAHGYAHGARTANVKPVDAYIQRMTAQGHVQFPGSHANQSFTVIDRQEEIAETMMVGLRLTEMGVDEAGFMARFGTGLEDLFSRQIKRLRAQGLLEWTGTQHRRLRLTKQGRLVGNRVFREFI